MVHPAAAPVDASSMLITHRLLDVTNAITIQQLLIAAGNGVARATCPFNVAVWRMLLVSYVPSDPCYTADVLIAGMMHGSYVRYEGSRTAYIIYRGSAMTRPMVAA